MTHHARCPLCNTVVYGKTSAALRDRISFHNRESHPEVYAREFYGVFPVGQLDVLNNRGHRFNEKII